MTTETKFLIATVVITLGVLIGGAYYFTQSGGGQPSDTVEMSKVLSNDAQKTGSPQAKVKIAEFSDFQCPACGAAHPIVKQVLKEYGDKVYFEYHHFPLAIHNWSQVAAEAGEAAAAQGKFWEYHDILFERQNDWSPSKDAVAMFKQYAKDLGLDEKKFNEDLDKHVYKDKVVNSYTHGAQLQVQATPTFFVNGKRIEGGMSLDDWKKTIDAELKN